MEATLRDILDSAERQLRRKEQEWKHSQALMTKSYRIELQLSISESHLIVTKLKRAIVEFDIHMINTIQHAN